jgi:hypothetical protein
MACLFVARIFILFECRVVELFVLLSLINRTGVPSCAGSATDFGHYGAGGKV